jgi:hypothetical protein
MCIDRANEDAAKIAIFFPIYEKPSPRLEAAGGVHAGFRSLLTAISMGAALRRGG